MNLWEHYFQINLNNEKRKRNYMLYCCAKINENNVVVDTLVVDETKISDENGINDLLATSFSNTNKNTTGNWIVSGLFQEGSEIFRGRQASIEDNWDPIKQKFYAKKPHDSWILDEVTLEWNPPIPRPNSITKWNWNEETRSWVLFDQSFVINKNTYNETTSYPNNENFGGTI